MATALSTNPDLECSICFDQFKIPKILSCGHSFCLRCLERYIVGRKGSFPCPVCKQNVKIPRGGVHKFITNFSLQTSTDSTGQKPKHSCPHHIKKEVEYYCQTCSLGLCYKCMFKDHKDHKTLDLECDSTKEKIVEELSQFVKNKVKDLEKTLSTLLETSEKLKSFCDEACTKISEKTEKIIGELLENCKTRQKEIRNDFVVNESQLTETRQKVMTQMKNIQTDLDTPHPTTTDEPSLTFKYSLTKLQNLQKLCENIETDIPPVTYLEWREGSVNVWDILGSTVTKPLCPSSEGSEPISIVPNPHQYFGGRGPVSIAPNPHQYFGGIGPVTNVPNPHQYFGGSGSLTNVPNPHQYFGGIGPVTNVPNPHQYFGGRGSVSIPNPHQYFGGSGSLTNVPNPHQYSWGSGSLTNVPNPHQYFWGRGLLTNVPNPLFQSSESSGPISTVTKPLYQSSEGSGPISTVTKPLYQSSEGSGPISTVTKPLYQSSEGSGAISTVIKPPNQSSEDSGAISTVTKPLYQSSEGSGPISTGTKTLYQSSEGSGAISTVIKPPNQSSEDSGAISTVTKPPNQSSESSGPISTGTKTLYQSSEGTGPISTGTKTLYQSSEGSGPISTVTKPLYQSSEGTGPISTGTKPIYQSSEGSGPISTGTNILYQSSEGNVFRFNYKDIERDEEWYYSKDKCTSHGVVWSCKVMRDINNTRCLNIYIGLPKEDNPRVKYCEVKYTNTILNKDTDKKVISETKTERFIPGVDVEGNLSIPCYELNDPSEGFIDHEGQLLVRFEILQVLATRYKWFFQV